MKQLVDLIAFLISLFYVFVGPLNAISGSTFIGGLMFIGALAMLYGNLTSQRKIKPQSNKLLLGGILVIGLVQLYMGSLVLAGILALVGHGIYATRFAKNK